ncbi:restriction endonuclease subunit S [Vibrio ulleungensis]|jgi:restriction endonuclease S subunit|uniref:Restriction endonuclease subunit S n=1 Tax=Vibrio ulleungensis TaxID=2807619 RepID=A0ABS2HDH6_9VIBR|nr:restriction endonuclease subunit S [Vibrio ulleungensis]MBM7035126.1 restriction endonuclease subunit S [Vibrio ulleungensis]
MSDFEKELEAMSQQVADEPEVKLPSMEEQKEIAAKLKELEEKGELTPEVLEQFFGHYYAQNDKPVH